MATLAFADDLFHYTGDFTASVAIRNLYVEAARPGVAGAWVGSRIVRGDDIYLLDAWPLDDLNLVGGGAWARHGSWHLRIVAGANRLRNPFQHQDITVVAPTTGTTTIAQLDRQRFVASITPTYTAAWWKARLYVDVQALASGTRRRADDTLEPLPADRGWTAGAELGAWRDGARPSFANVFLKLSRGLAAFDELAVPSGLGPDKRATAATELVLGTSTAVELTRGGAQLGAYVRRFVDADRIDADRDDGWQYVIDIRPYVMILDVLHMAVDVSYQRAVPRGVSPTRLEATTPAVVQVAPMLIYAPHGPGALSRPHLRIVYRAAHLNDDALDLYPVEDPRRARAWVHFLGLQAEWWFNSTTYP